MKNIQIALACCLAAILMPSWAGEAEWYSHIAAGDAAFRKGNHELAETSYKTALSEAEASFPGNHIHLLAASLNKLAALYLDQGRYAEAEPFYQRNLAILEKILGPEHPGVATNLSNLARLYSDQGRYAEAEPLYKRSLAIRERALGPEHPDVALSLHSLAFLYKYQGRYAEAEPLYKRSLAIRERALGPEHPIVADSLDNLAELYRDKGRYTDAEPFYQRSLAIREKAFGLDHPDVANSLNNLAALFYDQGRYFEGELLYQRSLAIREKALGPEDPEFATLLFSRLAQLYHITGRYAEAEPFYQRHLAILEKVLGPEHPDVATNLSNLARLYSDQGRYAEAEPLYKRSLAIREKALGPKHPDVANSLNNLAVLYAKQGRYAEAEQFFMRSLSINEMVHGPEHPDVAICLDNLAEFYSTQGRYIVSLPYLRRATQILTTRFSINGETERRGLRNEQRKQSGRFEAHVALLSAAVPAAGSLEAVTSESFEVAQWARASNTAEQMAKMAARHAAGSDALARVTRERQDLLARLEKFEADLLTEVSKPADQRNAERDRNLRQSEAETKNRLRALDERIAREFPRYGEITQPKPLMIAEAQKLLAPDEALLLWLVGEKESYMWAVRRDQTAFHKIALSEDELDTAVRQLRQRLDLGASGNPARLLSQAFDAASAHNLYLKLLGPAEGLLTGAKHLILVPDGPLQGLPPAVLVTEAPKTPIDHRDVAWLIKKYALTVLPSANSLRALRAFAARTPGKDPLIGFGDPVLDGSGEAGEAKSRGRRVPAGLVSRGAVADPKEVRKMDPLPNTADELKRIAASLKAPASALHLGAQATEARVKQIDLSRARVLAFATHGLMAEEFQGMAEPALVLTPPQEASAQDDGLLTASEISQLRLNADWVVLSACNTAASDGKPGAEGLSGLARAFFYAGARALMVSHWAVETNSSAALTTGAFDQSAKGLTKAEALRQSMLALIGRKDIPHADHPALWAPFVVVGEGGEP